MSTPDPAAVQRHADELTEIIDYALQHGYTPPRGALAAREDSPDEPSP